MPPRPARIAVACRDGPSVELPAWISNDSELVADLSECSDGAPEAVAVPFPSRTAEVLAEPRRAGDDLRLFADAIRLARFLGAPRAEERLVSIAGAIASALGPDRAAELFSSGGEGKKSATSVEGAKRKIEPACEVAGPDAPRPSSSPSPSSPPSSLPTPAEVSEGRTAPRCPSSPSGCTLPSAPTGRSP